MNVCTFILTRVFTLQVNVETSTQRPVLRLEIPKKGKNSVEKSKTPTPTNQMEGNANGIDFSHYLIQMFFSIIL